MAEVYDTVEVRWILDGPLPTRMEAWYEAGRISAPETRTDRYVVMRACPSVGIKLRDSGAGGAKLDVKARCGQEVELRLAPAMTGRAAAWSKWTLELSDRGAIGAGFGSTTPSVTVHKRRYLRRLVPADPPREVAPAHAVLTGCDVELTTITLDDSDQTWWSLAFEAFGPSDRAWASLRAIGSDWFERHGAPPVIPPKRLDLATSMAYPDWLADRLAGR